MHFFKVLHRILILSLVIVLSFSLWVTICPHRYNHLTTTIQSFGKNHLIRFMSDDENAQESDWRRPFLNATPFNSHSIMQYTVMCYLILLFVCSIVLRHGLGYPIVLSLIFYVLVMNNRHDQNNNSSTSTRSGESILSFSHNRLLTVILLSISLLLTIVKWLILVIQSVNHDEINTTMTTTTTTRTNNNKYGITTTTIDEKQHDDQSSKHMHANQVTHNTPHNNNQSIQLAEPIFQFKRDMIVLPIVPLNDLNQLNNNNNNNNRMQPMMKQKNHDDNDNNNNNNNNSMIMSCPMNTEIVPKFQQLLLLDDDNYNHNNYNHSNQMIDDEDDELSQIFRMSTPIANDNNKIYQQQHQPTPLLSLSPFTSSSSPFTHHQLLSSSLSPTVSPTAAIPSENENKTITTTTTTTVVTSSSSSSQFMNSVKSLLSFMSYRILMTSVFFALSFAYMILVHSYDDSYDDSSSTSL